MRRRIDWLNHTLEFFVVIVGILLAFQLNKCSDNRSKEKLIESHLTQIHAEGVENAEKLEADIQLVATQVKYCDSLMMDIASVSPPLTIRNWATKLLDLRSVELSETAYDVLVQSGDIRYLKDYAVKNRIISLYEGLDEIERINASNQNLYDNHFYPYVKSNFDLINWQGFNVDAGEKDRYYAKEFANTVSTYRYLLIA